MRQILLERFAVVHSRALQQTLLEMGSAVLAARDDIAEIRLSAPNKHHFLVDLAPFGLDNPGEVFHADDRPYGLIQCAVRREGGPDAGPGLGLAGGIRLNVCHAGQSEGAHGVPAAAELGRGAGGQGGSA